MADRKIFANQGPTDPHLKKNRFDLSFKNNLTARLGRIYPVFCKEGIPGGHYKIQTDFAFDVDPMVFPIQSNIRAHLSFFKIPMRILWKNFKNFYGQVGSDGQINGANSYEMPYISQVDWAKTGSLADYMGVPTSHLYAKRSQKDILMYKDVRYNSNEIISQGDTGVIRYYGQLPYSSVAFTDAVNSRGTIQLINYSPSAIPAASITNWQMDFCRIVKHEQRDLPDYYEYVNLGSDFNNVGNTIAVASTRYTINGSTYYRNVITITASSESLTKLRQANIPVVGVLVSLNPRKLFYNIASGLTDGTISFVNDASGENASLADAKLVQITTSVPQFYGVTSMLCNVESTSIERSLSEENPFDAINGAPLIPINALPFRAYEFIYRYFFENRRVSPFYKDNKPVYDEYLTNDGDGADSSTPTDFFNCPYEYDVFTTCVPTPFFGNAPLVGVTTNNETSATFNFEDGSSFEVDTQTDGVITGISMINGVEKSERLDVLRDAIQFGISIADFRNVNALTKFQEKHMAAGSKFQNIVYQFFGTNPPIGEEYPVYLGGMSRNIQVSKITNTAQSDGNPLGDFAGTASFRGASKQVRCFCSEPCYIMGILYFTVTPTYSQMLPFHFTKSKLLDYYNPLFANISAQPVMKRNLAPLQLVGDELNDVFGYNRPYYDYVSSQDEVHGDFRDTRSNFLMQRLFASAPYLNKRFLEIHSGDLTDVFAVITDNDKFFGQIGFNVVARLPIPRYSIPQII